jgi:hypothetical protein
MWLAWRLPRRLVYWCAIRVGTYEPPNLTPDDFAKWEIVPARRVVDAIRLWDL